MKEVPVPFLRANQCGIVLTVSFALLTRNFWLIPALLVVELAGLLGGSRFNLFVRIAKPLLQMQLAQAATESVELTRFNNTLAVAFLAISSTFLVVGWTTTGLITAGLLATVAFIASCGFCLGCFLFFQFKMLRRRFLNT